MIFEVASVTGYTEARSSGLCALESSVRLEPDNAHAVGEWEPGLLSQHIACQLVKLRGLQPTLESVDV